MPKLPLVEREIKSSGQYPFSQLQVGEELVDPSGGPYLPVDGTAANGKVPVYSSTTGRTAWGAYPTSVLTSVATVTALRGTAGSAGDVIVLLGFSAAGDGGGGTFYWDAADHIDDGGTAFNAGGFGATSAGWRRFFSGPLDVRWFGAAGDGVTDDTTSIQRAIYATGATTGYKAFPWEIYLPTGRYRITSSLICYITAGAPYFTPRRRGVSIRGAGRENSVIVVDADTNTDGLVYSAPTLPEYGLGGTLQDFAIVGSDLTSGRSKVRDLLVVGNWLALSADRITTENAGRHNLRVYGGMTLNFSNSWFQTAGENCALLGQEDVNPLGTTTNFYNCYFDSAKYECVKIWNGQLDTDFYSCVFQSAGNGAPVGSTRSVGLEVIDGHVGLYTPYFEANATADAHFGVDALSSLYYGVHVTVVSPKLLAAVGDTAAKVGLRFNRVFASSVTGGHYPSTYSQPIAIEANAGVTILAFPDDEVTSRPVQGSPGAWSPIARNTDGSPGSVRRHFKTAAATPGTISAGRSATVTVPFVYGGGAIGGWLAFGDLVTASYDKALPAGVFCVGTVTKEATGVVGDPDGGGEVTVSICNLTASPVAVADGNVAVEATKRDFALYA